MIRIDGKRVVVTGGASGIGAGVVKAMAEAGAAVVSLDINAAGAEAVAREVSETSSHPVVALGCDITDQKAVNAAFDQAVAELGGLDCLAMVAGNEGGKAAEDVTAADIDWLFDVHVKGTMFTNAAAYRAMRETGGSIVNTSSIAGVQGYPNLPVYSAAKAAILGYTRTVARDWGPANVRVNAICPAAVTPQSTAHFDRLEPEAKAQLVADYGAWIPLGGWMGTVAQSANVYVFLASDEASFLTGQMIAANGGWTMPR
jgi:NAD(P)-dependent dehydrogenase (short-subunit alcohol dehydrogenase family)